MESVNHPRLSRIIAEERSSIPLGIVFPCDLTSITSAKQITDIGLARVVLIGPRDRINSLAVREGVDIKTLEILDTPDDAEIAARIAASESREGRISVLMKGALHTDELMSVVVSKAHGLRTERRISHVFLCDLPGYHKLIALADCVVNHAPNLEHKRHILFDAIAHLHRLGIERPKVAIVATVEVVNPQFVATTDAAALVQMAKEGYFPNSTIEGPFGFDNAISRDCARMKNIDSDVSGDPDLLLMPNLEAANILYKAFVHVSGATCAGVITGAQIPIVLTSRADSVFSRIASVAVAVRAARNRG
ncbi:MAG: bifunctional enoyl-CoA hydratase/phosphate acetyltransferase [Betaproteobacteria bacterium]|nr:bifunctional enoyl-CoA hydratase/phosphate acetyltransferase [Betaproteobacteria bacterium]NCA15472.1 bifunctional enoyl-CoA hydratase/phosphate acetyltransferase [Betaproteobacteria bacterium]